MLSQPLSRRNPVAKLRRARRTAKAWTPENARAMMRLKGRGFLSPDSY